MYISYLFLVHFADCNLIVKEKDIVILTSTNNSVTHLLYTLEALFVPELKLFINTQLKDDYKSRKQRTSTTPSCSGPIPAQKSRGISVLGVVFSHMMSKMDFHFS